MTEEMLTAQQFLTAVRNYMPADEDTDVNGGDLVTFLGDLLKRTGTAAPVWDATAAAAFVAGLAPAGRETLTIALANAADADTFKRLLTHIESILIDERVYSVAGVVFHADSPDGGGEIFLSPSGTVYFADPETEPAEIDFDGLTAGLLMDLYQHVGPESGLAIIPALGEDFLCDEPDAARVLPQWIKDRTFSEHAIEDAKIVKAICEQLEGQLHDIAGVIFTGSGDALSECGKVLFRDGREPQPVAFGPAGQLIKAMCTNVGPQCAFGVIPASGATLYTDADGPARLEEWITEQTTR